jgi:hypothetical protein
MGAYKQFLSTDVIVSPLVVNKSFSFEGSASFTTNGIGIYLGTNYTSSNFLSSSLEYDQRLKYNSIKQLYYTNYIPNPISGSPYITDFNGNVVEDTSKLMFIVDFIIMNLQHYFKLTLIFIHQIMVMKDFFQPSSRTQIGIISIPKNLFGDYINPNTFRYKFLYNGLSELELFDNGEGIIVDSGKSAYGIINYQHGTIVITDTYTIDPSYFTSSLHLLLVVSKAQEQYMKHNINALYDLRNLTLV